MTIDAPQILGWDWHDPAACRLWWPAEIRPRSYAILNILGAAGVAVAAYVTAAWPAFALETIWALIAIRDLRQTYSVRPTREIAS